MIEFLPSYVGSKKKWVASLSAFKGKIFVEPFCGSAVLSANLASFCALNDKDPMIAMILERFDELIVPETFTEEDYMEARGKPDWWRYAYCLQAMSFSGVFRYSKNGYNVPIKIGQKPVHLSSRYTAALDRWKKLSPIVTNKHYTDVSYVTFTSAVVVLDPPYFGSKAAYNDSSWDDGQYFEWVDVVKKRAEAVILFDRSENLKRHNIPSINSRNMRVNGKYKGDEESIAICQYGKWQDKPQLALF